MSPVEILFGVSSHHWVHHARNTRLGTLANVVKVHHALVDDKQNEFRFQLTIYIRNILASYLDGPGLEPPNDGFRLLREECSRGRLAILLGGGGGAISTGLGFLIRCSLVGRLALIKDAKYIVLI